MLPIGPKFRLKVNILCLLAIGGLLSCLKVDSLFAQAQFGIRNSIKNKTDQIENDRKKQNNQSSTSLRQSEHQVKFKDGQSMEFLLYIPKEMNKNNSVPLVLFLHGAGERGKNLNLVKVHGPPKLVEQGKEFPFVLVSPQCPRGVYWNTDHLSALLDYVQSDEFSAELKKQNKTLPSIDTNRQYVTGLSMGGAGTWNLAMYSPDRFAAIVPICGFSDVSQVKKLKDLPVWAFHGTDDRVVKVERTLQLVEELKTVSEKVKYTEYPKTGHDSWTRTYENPKVYEWMLKHKRKEK